MDPTLLNVDEKGLKMNEMKVKKSDLSETSSIAKDPVLKTSSKETKDEGQILTPKEIVLSLFTPPFYFRHGYIFDSNNQMVSDEGREIALGTIISRIRGWGMIQYKGTPEVKAEEIQDAAGEIIAEALNQYWKNNQTKPE